MSFFICIVRLDGQPVNSADQRPLAERLESRGLDDGAAWQNVGNLSALTRLSGDGGPRLARLGSLVGVGDVRFDNPGEIADRFAERQTPSSHVELALQAMETQGVWAADEMLGDFAWVAWDSSARCLLAVRDAFGVKPLFYTRLGHSLVAFSSHASLLGVESEVSEEYIAKNFVRSNSEEDTIFESVEVFPAAHTLIATEGDWSFRRYWSPERFNTDPRLVGPDAAEEFRRLFAESVRLRLEGGGPVWSELSGGLDTSAIVSMSSLLQQSGAVDRGLSGTVTYADSIGSGDESEFVDAVVQASGVLNEQVRDSWPWQEHVGGPMRTEIPGPTTFFWSRNRRRDRILGNGGAEILLSGLGGDHLVEGNLRFFADRLAAGALGRTLGDMAHWAALQQTSFWKFAFSHGVVPFLPGAVRLRLLAKKNVLEIPDWVSEKFRKNFDMDAFLRNTSTRRLTEGMLPRYRAGNVENVKFLPRSLPRPNPSVPYERRYPFLYRPLVELALQFPPELKVHPNARKIVLREAMEGVLPEKVRTRLGKGGVGSRMLWALKHEQRRIDSMLRDPLLAQMGYVDAARLQRAYENARTGKQRLTVPLFITLALETWLLIEFGRWPRLEEADHSNSISTQKERTKYGTYQATVPEARAH